MRKLSLASILACSVLLSACEPRMAMRLKSNDEISIPAPTTEVSLVEDETGLTPVIIEEDIPEEEPETQLEEEEAPPPPPPPPSIEEQIETLTAPIYFQLDSYALNGAQIAQLEQLAAFLTQTAQSDLQVRIEGHCDDRGTREYNFALGSARANTIASYLVRGGVAKERISTISYGKERPKFTGTSKVARARNRRGDIYLRTE